MWSIIECVSVVIRKWAPLECLSLLNTFLSISSSHVLWLLLSWSDFLSAFSSLAKCELLKLFLRDLFIAKSWNFYLLPVHILSFPVGVEYFWAKLVVMELEAHTKPHHNLPWIRCRNAAQHQFPYQWVCSRMATKGNAVLLIVLHRQDYPTPEELLSHMTAPHD